MKLETIEITPDDIVNTTCSFVGKGMCVLVCAIWEEIALHGFEYKDLHTRRKLYGHGACFDTHAQHEYSALFCGDILVDGEALNYAREMHGIGHRRLSQIFWPFRVNIVAGRSSRLHHFPDYFPVSIMLFARRKRLLVPKING